MDIQLRRGEVLCVSGTARECRITCGNGVLWVTQDGDPRDYFIKGGEGRSFTTLGQLVIEAWAEATLTLRGNSKLQSSRRSLLINFFSYNRPKITSG